MLAVSYLVFDRHDDEDSPVGAGDLPGPPDLLLDFLPGHTGTWIDPDVPPDVRGLALLQFRQPLSRTKGAVNACHPSYALPSKASIRAAMSSTSTHLSAAW